MIDTRLKINQYGGKTEGRLYHRNIANDRNVMRVTEVTKSDDAKELKRARQALEVRAHKYIDFLDKATNPIKLEDMPKI